MTNLPDPIELDGVLLHRMDAPDDIACWTGEVSGDEGRSVSIIAEPPAVPSREALDAGRGVVADFDALAASAARFLVAELAAPGWGLSAEERTRLSAPEPPFDAPEAIVWQDGTWMIRFAECGLAMGEDFGIGVLFAGSTPVSVEDLSDAEDVDPSDAEDADPSEPEGVEDR
ncbi:hypothetical protein J2Y69_001914 [Microbacterium resistens]|uniref:DUF2262 domain-containing protein n=1 Tax=Microbacterium resistens TaxID=156977 RepID=A0ABU1SCJ0_9MICO|nr:hypothetical protein [Microbacterium resistens]MDR6867313.1 hypothetical protein [Microbacterium resistens]